MTAGVNTDILGIIELKLTGMGEFNSEDHYIHYCGQESLRRNGVAIIRPKCSTWCDLKKDCRTLVPFRGKPLIVTVTQVKAPTTTAEKTEIEQLYKDLQDLLETTHTHTHTHKDVIFIIGDWNAKEGSQEIPGVTGKFSLGVQNKTGQRLTEFCAKRTHWS